MALLSQRIGLNIHSVGHVTINRAITHAIKQSGQDEGEYLQQLKTSKATLDALIESVVVPETHFFRNPESFAYLLEYARQEQKRNIKGKCLRVLSLPCCSGEEPYSIAMTLMEAGLNLTDFQIDGVDISQQSLSIARQGLYKSYSFRNTATFSTQPYRDKYFTPTPHNNYHLNPEVRSRVKFYKGNLSDVICLPQHSPYDIIFCRNLLIYFHPSARAQALQNLDRLLIDNGLLFVGYAETRLMNQQLFNPLAIAQAFVFQKLPKQVSSPLFSIQSLPEKPQGDKDFQENKLLQKPKFRNHQKNNTSVIQETPSALRLSKSDTHHIDRKIISNSNEKTISDPTVETLSDDLTKIRKLANNGRLGAALEQCDAYLKENPTSAEGYLLLGEIYQAQGSDERADIAFHKVLYLNPNCIEALTHRLLLCEQHANQRMAEQLRQRIARLTKHPCD